VDFFTLLADTLSADAAADPDSGKVPGWRRQKKAGKRFQSILQ
jgi:hypothetical protein